MIISVSFTSEWQPEITDFVDRGDDIRTWRVFWFGLFETTAIFFPGKVLLLNPQLINLRKNKPCDWKTRENRAKKQTSNNPFEFILNQKLRKS